MSGKATDFQTKQGEIMNAATTNLHIRPLHESELPQVLALLDAHGLPQEGLAQHLATTLVATAAPGDGTGVAGENEIVGSAALECYGPAGLLRSVAVAHPWQGQGIGSALVDRALALARELGVAELYLLTETAAPYFTRRGFVPIERSEVHPAVTRSAEFTGACPQSAQAMRLALPTPPAA